MRTFGDRKIKAVCYDDQNTLVGEHIIASIYKYDFIPLNIIQITDRLIPIS